MYSNLYTLRHILLVNLEEGEGGQMDQISCGGCLLVPLPYAYDIVDPLDAVVDTTSEILKSTPLLWQDGANLHLQHDS